MDRRLRLVAVVSVSLAGVEALLATRPRLTSLWHDRCESPGTGLPAVPGVPVVPPGGHVGAVSAVPGGGRRGQSGTIGGRSTDAAVLDVHQQ